MTPEKGQQIIIFFRNGLHIDGKVISWTDNEAILQSLQGSFTTVIQKPKEDILMFKIHNAQNDYENLREKPAKNVDDIASLAELKNELNRIEREEIAIKLNTHEISQIKPVQYGHQQQLLKISRPLEHTRKEISRSNTRFSGELQNLFTKEYNKNRTGV